MPVSRDDGLGVNRYSTGQHLVIVRVRLDRWAYRRWTDHRRQRRITQHKILRGYSGSSQPPRELVPDKNLFQFKKEGGAGEKLDISSTGQIQHPPRSPLPQ